jgi:hypothetical protein
LNPKERFSQSQNELLKIPKPPSISPEGEGCHPDGLLLSSRRLGGGFGGGWEGAALCIYSLILFVLDFARVMIEDFLTKTMGVGVEIDFCGTDGFVAQHGLDGTQIGSTFEETGGETMAEGVGTYGFLNACCLHEFLDEVEDHDARDFGFSFGEKHVVLVARLDVAHRIAVDEIELELVDCLIRYRYKALLGTFAFHSDEFIFEIEVVESERTEFADSQSTREQHLYDGFVSLSFPFREINGVLQHIDLLWGEYLWQVFSQDRTLQQFRGVILPPAVQFHITEERPYPTQYPALGTRMNTYFMQGSRKML